jgi:enhancer of polycomb-like protein
MNMPHIDVAKPDVSNQSALNGVIHVSQSHRLDSAHDSNVNDASGSPPKPSQPYGAPQTNGFHLTPMTSLAAQALVNTLPNPPLYQNNNNASTLTMQQMQTIKSAFANNPTFATNQDLAQQVRAMPSYQFSNLQA